MKNVQNWKYEMHIICKWISYANSNKLYLNWKFYICCNIYKCITLLIYRCILENPNCKKFCCQSVLSYTFDDDSGCQMDYMNSLYFLKFFPFNCVLCHLQWYTNLILCINVIFNLKLGQLVNFLTEIMTLSY